MADDTVYGERASDRDFLITPKNRGISVGSNPRVDVLKNLPTDNLGRQSVSEFVGR